MQTAESSGIRNDWVTVKRQFKQWRKHTLFTESLNKRVENPGINGMLKININYKGKMQARLLGLFPPHVYSPNCHRPTPAKNPPRYCSLDYGYYHQTKDRIGGSLAKEQDSLQRKIAQFNNITSLGYYILEKNWQTASLQRVDY